MIRYGVSEPKCKYCESGRKLANIMEALVAVSESGGVIRVDSVNEDIVNEALKNNPVDALVLQRIYMELIGAYNSDMARERGIKRAELSDQHPAKQEVKKQWLSLTVGQKKYGYKAEFARSMVVKFPVLKSTKVIEGWCKDWELEAS